jgi:bromodomain-containing factor 1
MNETEKENSVVSESIDKENQVEPDPDPVLVKEQLKIFVQLIKNMKKKKDAFIFLTPVDPIALNIPTYFTVVKEPMDISTIEKKLVANSYSTLEEARKDVELMLNNCLTFNGPDSPVSLMAKNLGSWFEKEYLKIPTDLEQLELKKRKKSTVLDHLT